jgi:hypothetical protein
VLNRHEGIAHRGGAVARRINQRFQMTPQHLLRPATHFRLPVNEPVDEPERLHWVAPRFTQNAYRERVFLFEKSLAQVLCFHDLLLGVLR